MWWAFVGCSPHPQFWSLCFLVFHKVNDPKQWLCMTSPHQPTKCPATVSQDKLSSVRHFCWAFGHIVTEGANTHWSIPCSVCLSFLDSVALGASGLRLGCSPVAALGAITVPSLLFWDFLAHPPRFLRHSKNRKP